MKLYILTASILIAGAAVSKQCRDLPCRDFPNCPPEPLPTVAPTPVPTPPCEHPEPPPTGCNLPTPTPPPSGVGDAIPQHRNWQVVGEPFPSPMRPAPEYGDVLDSIASQALSCDIGSDCPTRMPMQAYIQTVAAVARNRGYDAGQHDDNESDEITIGERGRGGLRNQGYHIYNEGGGKVVWFRGIDGSESDWRRGRGPYRDTWTTADGPTPPATPTPTPTPTPIPTPPPTASCPPLTNLKIHAFKQADWIVDITPRGPDCARCASIAKSCDNGVCPLGGEGPNPEDNAARIACETGYGPYVFTFNGGPCDNPDVCFQHSDNPLSRKVKQSGQVCATANNGVGNCVTVTVQ